MTAPRVRTAAVSSAAAPLAKEARRRTSWLSPVFRRVIAVAVVLVLALLEAAPVAAVPASALPGYSIDDPPPTDSPAVKGYRSAAALAGERQPTDNLSFAV